MDVGIGYSIGAALVWGVYLFVLKRSFGGYPATTLTVLLNAFAILWYLPVTAASISVAELAAAAESLAPLHAAVVLGTAAATAAAFVLFLEALDGGDVSYVAPINKVVPVFVLPLEIVVLGQYLTPLQILGVVVATLAVYVANFQRGRLLDPIRRAAASRPAQLALVSAMCYALGDLGKRVALQELSIAAELWVLFLLGTVLVLLLPSGWRARPADVRGDLPLFAAAAVLVAVGEHLTTLAFALVPASIASPIINTQAIVAVVLGGILLREEYFATRAVAAILAVTGVALIAV
ncbi:EamA family transporter [Haloferacaceae archaeon DSL9]